MVHAAEMQTKVNRFFAILRLKTNSQYKNVNPPPPRRNTVDFNGFIFWSIPPRVQQQVGEVRENAQLLDIVVDKMGAKF